VGVAKLLALEGGEVEGQEVEDVMSGSVSRMDSGKVRVILAGAEAADEIDVLRPAEL
jgi:hypothetical protein